jgi:Flp pilus assembly protein TadD
MKQPVVARIKSLVLVLFCAFYSSLNAQERHLVKAKEEIMKSDFFSARERLEKYAEKAGKGAEYQYVNYLYLSRQARNYKDHVLAYETFQACASAFNALTDKATWCNDIQLCDTMFTNEEHRCFIVSYKAIESNQTVDDVEDYLTRFENSPLLNDATRLRDKLRLDEANKTHTIEAYEQYKKTYTTEEFTRIAQDSIHSIAFYNAVTSNSIDGYKSFLKLYPKAQQFNAATGKLVDLEWKQAQQTATIEGYKVFLRNYPGSSYGESATKAIEELEWAGSLTANSISGYKNYLELYPKGTYVNDANNRLDNLYWAYMEEKQTIESIRQFIQERPNSSRLPEAKSKLEDAIWAKAENSKAEEDLRAYLTEYTAGKYSHQASDALDAAVWQRTVSQPSAESLSAYIAEFKSGKSRSEAEMMLEEIHWQQALNAGTASMLEQFIAKYPTSKYKEVALEGIDDLQNFVLPYLNNNHKYQLYNVSKSSFVSQDEYDDVIPTSAKSYIVKKFSKYGALSKSGQIILPLKFDCLSFDGIFYTAEIGEKIAVMNLKGEEVNHNRFTMISKLNNNYYSVSMDDEDGNPGTSVMNISGEFMLPFDYSSISEVRINKETAGYIACKKGMFYLLNKEFATVSKGYASLTFDYTGVFGIGSEYYIFKEGNKYGVISADGKQLIAASYDELNFLKTGYLFGVKAGKMGIIKADNSVVLPFGNYQTMYVTGSSFVNVSLKNPQDEFSFQSKVFNLTSQKFVSEMVFDDVSAVNDRVLAGTQGDKKFIISAEGKILLTIDEFTNSVAGEMYEGDGYAGDGMDEMGDLGEESDYYCYPVVTGPTVLETEYQLMSGEYYIVDYYHSEKGAFIVYLDTNFKVINEPKNKFSKFLGSDLTFSSYVPSADILFARDADYNQYIINVSTEKRTKSPEDFSIRDFYRGYYTAFWKDALIYYPYETGKALIGDKVDFSKFNASKAYNEGISLYYQDDHNGAISKFREALSVFPNYADAYFQIGMNYVALNNNYEAQKNYKEAIRLDPKNSYYIETLYDVLYGLKDWDSMLSTARNAINSGKEENALDHFYMGLAYHSKGLCNDAISSYTRAIAIDQYLAAAYHNRGLCYMNNGKYDSATKDITIGLVNCKYCSNDILATYNQNLGDAFNAGGDKVSACRFWQRAYKLSSKYNKYLYNGCK